MPNAFNKSVDEAESAYDDGRVSVGIVTLTDETNNVVEVTTDEYKDGVVADVAPTALGDRYLPPEGTAVLVWETHGYEPIILGSYYRNNDAVPDVESGERVVSHPLSNSRVYFQSDGTLRLEGHTDTTVELQPDGDVVINGGSTRPVVDVDFQNNTVTRATDVFVPK